MCNCQEPTFYITVVVLDSSSYEIPVSKSRGTLPLPRVTSAVAILQALGVGNFGLHRCNTMMYPGKMDVWVFLGTSWGLLGVPVGK
jgi:hypothetical protein